MEPLIHIILLQIMVKLGRIKYGLLLLDLMENTTKFYQSLNDGNLFRILLMLIFNADIFL